MTPGREQLADLLSSLRNSSLRYADIRFTETRQQHVKVRNGEIDHLASTVDRAVGVRVLVGDGWGFAATSDLSEPSLRTTALRALEVAAASRSEEHTSELQSPCNLVCRLLLEKKNTTQAEGQRP